MKNKNRVCRRSTRDFETIARRFNAAPKTPNSLLIYLLAPEIVGRHRSKYLRIPRSVALAFGRSRR
ncbi:MAG TPA: hypothetical protein PKA58_23130, partial [Polyangium sp.]|nr:hypothetical protein [Polyangium sp.]